MFDYVVNRQYRGPRVTRQRENYESQADTLVLGEADSRSKRKILSVLRFSKMSWEMFIAHTSRAELEHIWGCSGWK